MDNKKRFQDIVNRLYDEKLQDKIGTGNHSTFGAARYYTSGYEKDNSFQIVYLCNIELYRDGEQKFCNESMSNVYLDVSAFLDAVEECIFGTDQRTWKTEDFIKPIDMEPREVTKTVTVEKVIEKQSARDIRNEGKVEVLTQVLELITRKNA